MNYHITRLVIVCGHFSRKKCEKFRVEPFTPVYLLAFDSFLTEQNVRLLLVSK